MQRVSRLHFVVTIGAHQQHAALTFGAHQVFEQAQGRYVGPLQVVEEQQQRVIRCCQRIDKLAKADMEPMFALCRRHLRQCGQVAEQAAKLGNQVGDRRRVVAQCIGQSVLPVQSTLGTFSGQGVQQLAKRLAKGGIGLAATVLIALSAQQIAAAGENRSVQFVDQCGLANPRVTADQQQFGVTGADHALEGRENAGALGLTAVQLLRHAETLGHVDPAQFEAVDAMVQPPDLGAGF